jgi:hypothetical protein
MPNKTGSRFFIVKIMTTPPFDKAFARAFNSRMRLANPKNLVRADDACLLRYTMEA